MIRGKVSDILEVRIQPNKWEAYVEMLDREGKFTRKTMIRVLMALCQAVEELENSELDDRVTALGMLIHTIEKDVHEGKRNPKTNIQPK